MQNPTMQDVMREVEAVAKHNDDYLRKIEAKMNRQTLALGGAAEPIGDAATERKAFESYARTGETKGMSISDDTAGGYARVPPTQAAALLSVGAEEGATRGLARVENPDGGGFEQPIAKNLAGAIHVGETSDRSETSTPDFALFTADGGALAAVAPVTNWLMQDTKYDLAAFIISSIGQQFGVTESADFVVGDGVLKSRGFTTYPLAATGDAERPWGTIEKLHAGSTTTFDIDDLIDLKGKLAPRYRRNACWMMNPDTETHVRKLKSSSTGDYYWVPSTQAGEPNTLLGLPVFVDVNMPVIGSGNAVVAVADWKKFYCIVDIGQPIMLRDQLTVKGKTLFYCEKRVDAGVLDFNAGKLLVMSV